MYATVKDYLYRDYKGDKGDKKIVKREKNEENKRERETEENEKNEENKRERETEENKRVNKESFALYSSHSKDQTQNLVDTDKGNNSQLPTHPSSQNGTCQCNPSGNTSDPKVWGPAFWYTLHVSAAHYPLQASQIVKDRMKRRLLSIPYELPCQSCRSHASAFIEKNRDRLDEIVSGRHNLGQFYVDFHNQVNKRYNKPEWTYTQAYKKYAGTN